jgi:hypothetical protein
MIMIAPVRMSEVHTPSVKCMACEQAHETQWTQMRSVVLTAVNVHIVGIHTT